MNKILDLRQWAQTQLGAGFQLREFHDAVLNCGAVPLDVLEVVVKDWVVQTQKKMALIASQ